jgi:hypothetical protein
MSSKELHDRWLEQKPEGASHPEDCPFCLEAKLDPTGGAGDSMSDKTHTAEDIAAAVALATKPLEDKIRDLEAEASKDETAAQIAEATAELETKLADAQGELDVKVAEAEAAKQELADVIAFLEAEEAAKTEAAAAEARKAERVEKVKESANFSDDYLAENADRWAKMADEDFDALVETIKTAAPKKEGASADDKIPADTKLAGASEKASQGEGGGSALSTILDLRRAGIDARRL